VEYDEDRFARIEQQQQEKQRHRLLKQARKMGYALVPLPPAPAAVVS
jgi:hypothetical protein